MLGFLLAALPSATAQRSPRDKTDRAAIDYARSLLVSTLDRNLPKVTLEFFLENESDGARIQWEVNDCGEQTGSPEVDRGRDFPMCVEAEVFLKDQRSLNVSVTVGTFKKGVDGKPFVWGVMLTETDGEVRSILLRAIPMELHRPENRAPKELPGINGRG